MECLHSFSLLTAVGTVLLSLSLLSINNFHLLFPGCFVFLPDVHEYVTFYLCHNFFLTTVYEILLPLQDYGRCFLTNKVFYDMVHYSLGYEFFSHFFICSPCLKKCSLCISLSRIFAYSNIFTLFCNSLLYIVTSLLTHDVVYKPCLFGALMITLVIFLCFTKLY